MKLYELSTAYVALRDLIEEGQDFEESLNQISDEFDYKVESVAKMVREFEAEAKALSEEGKKFMERANAANNKAASLKSYLLNEMQAVGKDKIEGKLLKVALQKSPPSCHVINEAEIPADFIRIIPEQREPDKKAIIDAWKQGTVVPGVEIQADKKYVVIR